MSDTFLSALTAAGGNSRAARSARVRLQWRDRYGRWIEMGRGVKFKIRGMDGAVRSVIGSFVGAKDANTGQVYVRKDPNGLPDGFYEVSSANAQEFVANLSESQLAERGIELGKDANGQAISERASEDIPNVNEIPRYDAPEGWEVVPGKFGGRDVIQTEDGDFRIHFGGPDDRALLEDHRANPGVAEPQRSVAEAFRKVGDVDLQREESGDQAYKGLGSEEENAAVLANRDRDSKVEQIKFNERTLANDRAPLGAKQTAMTANEQLKKELADAGQPYDPQGNDSDEALAARKAASDAPETPTESDKPTVSAEDIDLSTFEVAPEGFLVPTGKRTDDISPEGLANFMTTEKEALGKGGARLVVDTDNNSAEIYNSADTLDNAKAQAGGLGQDTVLDLSTGKPVSVSEGAVDPNSPDVNPNLDGDTSPEAPNAEDRNSDAVESERADTGADAPASPESDGEAERDIPAATGDRAASRAEPAADAPDPGSVEDLQKRRAKVQAALDNAGDPKDIIALNEQADELDTRIAAKSGSPLDENGRRIPDEEGYVDLPEDVSEWTDLELEDYNADADVRGERNSKQLDAVRDEIARRNEAADAEEFNRDREDEQYHADRLTDEERDEKLNELADQIRALEERNERVTRELETGASDRPDEEISAELDKISDQLAELQSAFEDLDTGREYDPDFEPEMSLLDRLNNAWAQTDPFPESWSEKRERAALRILRKAEEDGDVQKGVARLSQEEKDALSDDIAEAVGIRPRQGQLDIQSRVREDGGLSIAPDLSAEPVDGYMVAVQGHNREIPEDEFFDGDRGAQVLVDWINDNHEALSRPGAHIGIWHDTANREVVLDVSERVENREEAERLGRERNQQAIWDVANGEEISTGGTGDREEAPDSDSGELGRPDSGAAARVGEEGREPTRNPAADGDAERLNTPETSELRRELDDIDAEIERELGLAEISPNEQEEAVHLSRVRTLERQRKIYENRLNRALGNEPMDFNRDLGWNMRNRENRGSLPEVPEAPAAEPEPTPEADTPAILDEEITPDVPVALSNVPPSSLREGDYIKHPETGNIVRITGIEYEHDEGEQATRYDISYESRNDLEYQENDDMGGIQLWSNNTVDTYRGWRDTPRDPAEPTDGYTPPANREEALARLSVAEADYYDVLMRDDYTEEEFNRVEEARWRAQLDLFEFDAEEQERDFFERNPGFGEEDESDADRAARAAEREAREEGPVTDEELERLNRESLETEREDLEGVIEREGQAPPRQDGRVGRPIYNEDEAAANVDNARRRIQEINAELGDREATEDRIEPGEGVGGLYAGDDDPYNVESGNDNKVSAMKAKLQGKDLTDEERAEFEEALNSLLSDRQVAVLSEALDSKPNRSDTITIPRPEHEQPDYLSTADLDIINAERDDPSYVFDEDLTWRRIREEFPNATELENGDLILDTTSNKGKRYDTMIRRTRKNRFMVYVMETDQQGNRRAKRIGNTEWHSYEALEKRIQQGRNLIHSKSPAGSLARRKDQPTENLGTQGFPADDFLGDIGNPDAPLPETGDEKFDRLLEAVALHIRNQDADIEGIEAHLQEIDPGANAINTIMQAVIGRAQDMYRPDGVAPWQTYDGETAEIGEEYDWTDWHQEKDWWLPNGQLNPNRKPNPNYGKVHRVRVMGYIQENNDGKGEGKSHTYGDHVWVQMLDDRGFPVGNWVKRSAQTLRHAEPGSPTGLPFFSKKEEWRSSPEALARRFRVPNAAPEEPVRTQPRPRGDLPQGRRLRFTSRGTLAGYSNVPVPTSPAEIIGKITSEEVKPQIRPARDARPGMMIARMDDEGNQFVDSIIRVENLGDGGYRIHAARPDGRGYADVDSFVVPGDADISIWTAPGLPGPRQEEPSNARRGELVSFEQEGQPTNGVVVFDDGEGNMTISLGNAIVDVPESALSTPEDREESEERVELIMSADSVNLPQALRDLIRRWALDPNVSQGELNEVLSVVRNFNSMSPVERLIDRILDMLGVPASARSDIFYS